MCLNRLSVFVAAGLGLAGRVSAGHLVCVVTPESPDPSGVSCLGSVQRARVPAPTLAHNDGLIRSMSTTGIAALVVWLITGLPRRDFSPGLTPATTSNPISEETIACPVCLPPWLRGLLHG